MMFTGLKQLCDTVIRDAEMQAMKAIDDNLGTMADMNREQLEVGLDANNSIFSYYMSDNYARFKKAIGSRAALGVTDLKLTGDFHSGIFARRSGDSFEFYSTDSKAGSLSDRYGDNIFGLTDQNKSEVTTGYIFPLIADWLTSQIRQSL